MRSFALKLLVLVVFVVVPGLAHAQTVQKVEFEPAYSGVVIPAEGYYANHPQDPGGETFMGVARKKVPKWWGWALIDSVKADLPAMPKFGTTAYRAWVKRLNAALKADQGVQSAVRDFYQKTIWQQYHLGECRIQDVADNITDALVNNGEIAAIWAKKATNRAAHKKVCNPKGAALTSADIKALNAQNQEIVLFWFDVYRGARYDSLGDKFEEFIDTWAEREIIRIIDSVHDRDKLLEVGQ